MQPMRRYYGSGPPSSPRQISLADLMQGRPGNGNSRPAARPAQASPQSPVIQQQQPPIMFVDAYGHQLPIYNIPTKGKTAPRIMRPYAASNGESPTTEAEPDDFEGHSSISTIVREEERRRGRIFFNPFIREESGHHFGGYHPPRLSNDGKVHGKNIRQSPSVRYLATAPEVSRLLGVPVHEMVSVGMTLQEIKEQREQEAWIKLVVAGNGRYR